MPVATPQPPASPSLKFITAVKSEAEFEEKVWNAPKTTLAVCDVYNKWCGPCVALGKRLMNLSSDYLECVLPRCAPPIFFLPPILSCPRPLWCSCAAPRC